MCRVYSLWGNKAFDQIIFANGILKYTFIHVQNNDSFWLFFNPNKWDEMMQPKHDIIGQQKRIFPRIICIAFTLTGRKNQRLWGENSTKLDCNGKHTSNFQHSNHAHPDRLRFLSTTEPNGIINGKLAFNWAFQHLHYHHHHHQNFLSRLFCPNFFISSEKKFHEKY